MYDFLKTLGIEEVNYGATTGASDGWMKTGGSELVSYSPIDGRPIAKVVQADENDYEMVVEKAEKAFGKWRMMPAPKRGEIVRQIGNILREYKEPLGKLVTLEMGKIAQEGMGEVQEMIDIADFAVGLSRQLYGLSMHSERPRHRMFEQWHPLGIVGIISAFNFPVAVWSWNSLIAAACGDISLWKPSSRTPLTAIAVHKIIQPVIDQHDIDGVFNLVIGSGRTVGERMINDKRVPLVSATGSTSMGRHVAEVVASRLGRTILELGGNNAIIITPDADMDNAIKATLFGAVGTSGQRCTTTRRIIIHNSIKDKFVKSLSNAYGQIPIGNPLEEGILMGPVVTEDVIDDLQSAIAKAREEGGKLVCGGERTQPEGLEDGYYVTPAIMEVQNHYAIVQEETFAPLLYIIGYDSIEEAIGYQNGVVQGLSSAMFTNNLKESQLFLSHEGSDCGIANINIGTSGAEIGGAFGGEKETGGGRESGSDAWKAYMRRQTCTVNWSDEMPLAQGIEFKVED
ncbi:MAG: aldehyde dehydrogenase family protein [Candidatus Aegiribacteria sp.]|nr:aldehyde dehydrogenase family protein [Candidatus Aegiribacteria sp.]MBD3294025.1 aldehyde dehydrogenase family protein [Candidatus Fermentibacteria bacterium]